MSSVAENASRPSNRVFRGWWIVVVAIIGQSCGIATVLVYTFAVFEKPLAHEFKSSRASIALAVSLLDILDNIYSFSIQYIKSSIFLLMMKESIKKE